MKRLNIFVSIAAVFAIGAKASGQFPQAEISNGIIHAKFYLPNDKEGYYRGSRFDWSGVMPSLEFDGHTYFGQWFEKYSPTLHDAIMGPVEDFLPVGYDDAKVGESFLKIGIGVVTKPEEPKYSIATPYHLINGGSWKVRKKSDKIKFDQKLNDKNYNYEYSKTVQLVKGKPEMVLSHTLKNTGKQAIETNVYNHNFFVMDKQPTGPDYLVQFPFNVRNEGSQSTGDLGKLQENQILFSKPFSKNDHLYYYGLQGYTNSPKDYNIRIENHKTGAAVLITSDQQLSRLVFWSAMLTLCPEPYIKVKVDPGESFSWKIFYTFYTCEKTIKN